MNLKLIDGTTHELQLTTPEIQSHFAAPNNCTREILHQFNDLDYYQRFLSKDDKAILDFGSNIGLFAIHVSPWAEKIVGYEPTPSHYALNRQLTWNFPNIEIINAAVGPHTGEIDFFFEPHNTTMNSMVPRTGQKTTVPSFSIPDILAVYDTVDFIKMDIEGSEIWALTEEAIEAIAKKVKKLLIEFHHTQYGTEVQHRAQFRFRFEDAGMKCEEFNNDGLFCSTNDKLSHEEGEIKP